MHETSRADSVRAWSEARAPAPPPSDKPGATPPGDAYAPLGAVAPVHRNRKHHRPPLGTRHRHRRRRPDGPPRIMHCTYAKFHNCTSACCRKSTTFDSLKRRGNSDVAKLWRQPRYRREQCGANKRRTFLVSS